MLPQNYTRIEYVQSDGIGSYFRTGIIPNDYMRVVYDGCVVSGDTALWGSRTSSSAWDKFALQFISSNQYRVGVHNAETKLDAKYIVNTRYLFEMDIANFNAYIDGKRAAYIYQPTSYTDYTLELYAVGALNTKGAATNFGVVKMYSMQFYEWSELKADFIPCLNAEGQPGIYDLVSDTFYGNAGTGTITVGRKMRLSLKQPDKLQYDTGEKLNLDGMQAVLIYEDGEEEDVTSKCTVSGYDAQKPGEQTVTVSYSGMQAEFRVEVTGITGIQITPPTKCIYHMEEELDTEGMTVTAVYSDGKTEPVTEYAVSGYQKETAGAQEITVTYLGVSAVFTVTVYAPVSMQLTAPSKTEYKYGEELILTDMVVSAVYEDDFVKTITDYQISGYDAETLGNQTVTVTYKNVSADFTVVVSSDTVAIEITSLPTKTEYKQGEEFENAGLEISTVSSAGEKAATTSYEISGFDSTVIGTQTITITHLTFTVTFEVKVVENIVTATCGSPTAANVTANLNLYTGVLTFRGTGAIKSYSSSSLLFSAYRSQIKEVVFEEGITNLGSYILYKCSSLEKVHFPETLGSIGSYCFYYCISLNVLENLNKATTLNSYAFYNCSSLTSVALGENITSIYSNSFGGCGKLTAIYVDQEYDLTSGSPWGASNAEVTWKTYPLSRLEIVTAPSKTEYRYGESFDGTGIETRLYYTDGTYRTITDVSVFSFSGYVATQLGKQNVMVTYRTVSAVQEVTVVNYVAGISIQTLPNKVAYEVGEEQDNTGLSIALQYADGTTETIADGYTISEIDRETYGPQDITVTYGEYTVTYSITGNFPTTLQKLLGKMDNMTTIRNNSKNDDGTDELAGVPWFSFNGVAAEKIYISGNNWLGFGISAEQLKVCRRDGAVWYTRRLEGMLTNGHRFLKLEVEGYTYYSSTSSSYKLVYEVYLFDDNSMFLYMVTLPTSSSYLGTSALVCGGTTVSYTPKTDSPQMFSFYPGEEGGKEWTAEAVPHAYLLDGIQITALPSKTEYRCGETFTSEGMVVSLHSVIGWTAEVTGYELSAFEPLVSGTQTITVTYQGYTNSFDVVVIDGFLVRFLFFDPEKNEVCVIKEETVNYGMDAHPPEKVEIPGYIFTGWSGDFGNITWDKDIYAKCMPKNICTVLFVDWDGTILKKQYVARGNAATAPEPPQREGMQFDGWNQSFAYVSVDMTVRALYKERTETYTVTFKGWNGSILKTETVGYSQGATAPSVPEREGYFFLSWSKNFEYVTENIITETIYREKGMQKSAVFYNGNARAGILKKAIECNIVQRLNGECTMELTTLAAYAAFVQKKYRIEFDGLIFNLTGLEKKTQSGKYLTTIKGEHVSYLLNDEEYDVEEFSFQGSPRKCLAKILKGTPFSVGPVDFTDSVTLKVNQKSTRRDVLMQLVALCGGEIFYDKYKIGIRSHIGETTAIELMDTQNVINVGMSYSAAEHTETYSIELFKNMGLSLGDEIHIVFRPLGLDKVKRIAGIKWNPFNFRTIDITVGGYRAALSDQLYQEQEKTDDTSQKVDALSDKIDGLSDTFDSFTGSLGGFNVMSVASLPDNPDMNTIYLIQGAVNVT